MSQKIIILDKSKFRDALQQNDLLFDEVCRLVEACDARHPDAHHIGGLSCTAVNSINPVVWETPERERYGSYRAFHRSETE